LRHAEEFGEFIRAQSGGRRYLSMSREEIVEACRHNQAGRSTARNTGPIMNIDTATKRRFLARVLEFIGYRDAVIELACSALGMRVRSRAFALVGRRPARWPNPHRPRHRRFRGIGRAIAQQLAARGAASRCISIPTAPRRRHAAIPGRPGPPCNFRG